MNYVGYQVYMYASLCKYMAGCEKDLRKKRTREEVYELYNGWAEKWRCQTLEDTVWCLDFIQAYSGNFGFFMSGYELDKEYGYADNENDFELIGVYKERRNNG